MSERAKEIKDVMAKHELEPDLEFIEKYMQYLRGIKTVTYGETLKLKQMDCELSLLNYTTQLDLMDTIERSIKSQDRLANSQILLAFIGAVIALLQLVGMFILRARAGIMYNQFMGG